MDVTTTISGLKKSAIGAISPGVLMPTSIRASLCQGRTRSMANATQGLKLSNDSRGTLPPSAAAVIRRVVVLPNDPTTAMIQVRGMIHRRYHAASGAMRGQAVATSLKTRSLWPTVVGQTNRSAAMRVFEISTRCPLQHELIIENDSSHYRRAAVDYPSHATPPSKRRIATITRGQG